MFNWILKRLEYYSEIYENAESKILSILLFIFGLILCSIFFVIMFTIQGVPEMVFYNFFAVIFHFSSSYFILVKHKYLLGQYIAVLNICVYVLFSSYFLGESKDVYIVIFPLVFAIYSISPGAKKHVNITALISGITLLIALYLRLTHTAKYEYELMYLEYINVIFAVVGTYFVLNTIKVSENIIENLKNAERIKLDNESKIDFLTGLYNKRYVEEEFVKTKKENGYIVLADIDFFKKVNDTYGHNIGDNVLKKIAKIMKSFFRDKDFVARWGGEEFFILVTDINSVDLMEKLNRLREAVGNYKFVYGDYHFQITITFGVEQIDVEKTLSENTKNADLALYYGKQNGRNQVVYFNPAIMNKITV